MNHKISEQSYYNNTQEKLFNYLRLIRSDNIGNVAFYKLLSRYTSAEIAIENLKNSTLNNNRYKLIDKKIIEREINFANKNNITFLTYDDPRYPILLKNSDNHPPVISIIGNIDIFNKNSLSVVGSRSASAVGLKLTQDFICELNQNDIIIVSGLARGIDTAAHRASIKAGTIAVLAGGVNNIYPIENKALYHSILDHGGAIISDAPVNYVPAH